MKKIIKPLFILVFFISIFIVSTISCQPDTNCTVQIYVKSFPDTTIVVPHAWVVVKSSHASNVPIGDSAFTDGNGMYSHVFPLEAIMDITATDNSTSPARYGTGSIRFVAGQTARTSVFVQ